VAQRSARSKSTTTRRTTARSSAANGATDRRVVGHIDADDPERQLTILVVEQVYTGWLCV
jgi:hypothetical protein